MAENLKKKRLSLTTRGIATKTRIVEAAAELVYERGAERVSLDHVMEASGTSKSQLYHYFSDKADLLREVVSLQSTRIVQANDRHLGQIDTLDALSTWRDMMIQANLAAGLIGGCPLGSLASELASQSEETRKLIDRSFGAWSAVIEMSLTRMKELGQLKPRAEPKALAVATLAAIQGGILLSKAARSTEPLELALDMAFAHIRYYAT
jgi:AcrR family transcriptional regulator